MPKAETEKANIDDVLASIVAPTTTELVCLRGDLLAEHERLTMLLAAEIQRDNAENRHAQAPVVAEQLQAVEAQIREAEVEFTFVSIGEQAWTDLGALEPNLPTDEDRANGYAFNPRTFPHAAVAASCTSPSGMTVEKSRQLAEKVSFGQWQKLWGACLRVNAGRGDSPFSLAASAVLLGSEPK